jgi:putative glutamine amidotransferase
MYEIENPYVAEVMKPRIGITSSPTSHEDRHIQAVNSAYVDAVVRAGGIPLLFPVLDPTDVADVIDTVDGLLFTGGGDIEPSRYGAPRMAETDGVDPARDAWELALAKAAFDHDLPILGVCRGSQLLNVARGGTLMQHLPDVSEVPHRERVRFAEHIHDVEVLVGSRLASIVEQHLIGVNTLHHQAVAEIGEGLRAVAWAPDGIIEGIEGTAGRRLIGVQWHPELLPHLPGHPDLFGWLVEQSQPVSVLGAIGAEPTAEPFVPAIVTAVA